MKRIALATGLLLVVAALAGVLRPDGAGAADPTTTTDTVSVTGTGSVDAVPDRAEVSAGVETRAATAKAALTANGAAMQKVIAALRANGGKDVTTQTVSLSSAYGDNGQANGFVASNVASAETSLDGAGALIDAAVAAGANTIYGPSLSRSDADALYRQALAKAVDDAKARAEILAKAAGRSLGRVTAIAESGSAAPVPYAAKASAAQDSTPVVSGSEETTASVSVTFELDLSPLRSGASPRGPGPEAPSAGRRCGRRRAGAGAARGGETTVVAVVLRPIAAGDRDVELGVAPHAVLGDVEPGMLSTSRLRPDPDRHLHHPEDGERGGERERAHRDEAERLDAELVEARRRRRGRPGPSRADSASSGTVRNPSESVPHTPGHAVRRECADRVVDPDLLDEENAEHDDRTGDEPDA